MSKLSELIKQAEQSQKQREALVEREIEARLNMLEHSFTNRLEQSFKRIDGDLQSQGEKVTQRLLELYKIPAYCIAGILILLCLVILYLSHLANGYWDDMKEWKQSAALYKAQSQNMVFHTCTLKDKTSRVCIQIDPQYKNQEWGDNLKVLTIKAD